MHPFHLLSLIVLFPMITCPTGVFAQPATVVLNPYENVDWENHVRHHGNFHTHTTESDGEMAPAAVIDSYKAIGHDILAITDHNRHTWPWTAFGRDPEKLDMLPVPGNELSRHHHTLSLFSDLTTDTTDHETGLRQINESGGIAVLAHPGRYWNLEDGKVPEAVQEKYAELFKTHDHLIGFEVVNQGGRYPQDRALWDALLTRLFPHRTVWGMANDDSHREPQIGLNTTVMLLPERTEKAVRESLKSGSFYFTTLTTHPDEAQDREALPVLRGIQVDGQKGLISLKVTCKGKALENDAFTWISAGGRIVHRGPTLNLNTTEGLSRYVRAEIRGIGGTAYTQPFGLKVDGEK